MTPIVIDSPAMKDGHRVLGVMSGSSLDGIDLALCAFRKNAEGWGFSIIEGRTVPYADGMRARLLAAMDAPALELARLHRDLGRSIGEACRDLLRGGVVDLVASHGHTIFHKPEEGLTTQIGCGARIAAIIGMPVACDFRTKDMALGGQGAPLVPLGERALFPGYGSFLNLGGIANLSLHQGAVLGYDIGPCNQALDRLASEAGRPYDSNGNIARSGRIDRTLLDALDGLDFYQLPSPRSLGREWFEERMAPLVVDASIPLADRLRTVTEHIARMIGRELDQRDPATCLATGGGAHNGLLIDRIRACTKVGIVVPERSIVDLKEAVIFAFLGLLRALGEVNTLCSVTGASRDSIGGAVHLPN